MLNFISSYLIWHYTYAFGELVYIFKNFIWAEYKLFSIKEMLLTIFYPWKKLDAQYPAVFDIGEFIGTFIVNTLVRIIGFFIKSIFIIIGIISILLTISAGVALIFIWATLPILIISLFLYGIKNII